MLSDLQDTVEHILPEPKEYASILDEIEAIGMEIGDSTKQKDAYRQKHHQLPKLPRTKSKQEELKNNAKECLVCQKPIFNGGAVFQGKYYHDEHFQCINCGQKLKNMLVFENNGELWCERDYLKKFGLECDFCKETISKNV